MIQYSCYLMSELIKPYMEQIILLESKIQYYKILLESKKKQDEDIKQYMEQILLLESKIQQYKILLESKIKQDIQQYKIFKIEAQEREQILLLKQDEDKLLILSLESKIEAQEREQILLLESKKKQDEDIQQYKILILSLESQETKSVGENTLIIYTILIPLFIISVPVGIISMYYK